MKKNFSNYIKENGLNLESSGTVDKGFSETEALELLNLMEQDEIELLGMEVWYFKKDGQIKIDSLSSWVPNNSMDTTSVYAEAREVISLACKTTKAIFTLQF